MIFEIRKRKQLDYDLKSIKYSCGFLTEVNTSYINHMDAVIATARSNRVATTLAMQDFSQFRKDYGREQADVIVNITGNVICGQVRGDTAKVLSERFGKILQEKESISINRMDTSISRSTQLDDAIPASKISALSSGEFVGIVTDDPHEKIKLKAFHAEIVNNAEKLNKEVVTYKRIPDVKEVTPEQITDNYYQVKLDVKQLTEREINMLKENTVKFKYLVLFYSVCISNKLYTCIFIDQT